ncbi:hypothetical protein ElyMa_006143700 [Elysia marginata]|uniref:Apple domain-containing protein n=1 Tax=Elysia marginata TaxID=1093978 RepID=A0AAV4GW68_9GAST|nr:hypothetical protein ElyMa_006143700 [Elysia marginata]
MKLDLTRVPMGWLGSISLLILISKQARSECLANPVERNAGYRACPLDTVHQNNITTTKIVPSITYCGNLCLSDTSCTSFNVLRDASGNLLCQLTMYHVTDCSTLSHVVGARSYVVKTATSLCSDRWRVALKTTLTSVVNGSVSGLQEAVLSGAAVKILQEPYPQSTYPSMYKGVIYAVNSVKLQDFAPYVTANVYTFTGDGFSQPLWSYVKMDTSGNLEQKASNGTTASFSSNTFTWLVQGVSSECYQQQVLSHNGAVSRPAFSVDGTHRTGQVSDVLSVLSRGSTARVVSHFGTAGSLAYPAYGLTAIDAVDSLSSMSSFIPGNDSGQKHLPLRVQKLNFSSEAPTFDAFLDINTGNGSYDSGFAKDPLLSKTEVFLDPCWELKWSISYDGNDLEGSQTALASALRSGARLLFVLSEGSELSTFEAEQIQLHDDNYFKAYSKMGVSLDNGYTWQPVSVDSDGYKYVDGVHTTHMGNIAFYTDKHERPFRVKVKDYNVIEGDWDETRTRLKSGLMPRALIETSSKSYILDLEYVKVHHHSYNVQLQSYLKPDTDGFLVYFFGLDGDMRADIGLYRAHGVNKIPRYTGTESITLFFENYPLPPDA